jgi:hypothetical protein
MRRTGLFTSPLVKAMSAADVARIGYRGLKAGKRVVIPGFANRMVALSARFSPKGMVLPIASYLNSEH